MHCRAASSTCEKPATVSGRAGISQSDQTINPTCGMPLQYAMTLRLQHLWTPFCKKLLHKSDSSIFRFKDPIELSFEAGFQNLTKPGIGLMAECD